MLADAPEVVVNTSCSMNSRTGVFGEENYMTRFNSKDKFYIALAPFFRL